jgi:O-antigen/teichoic acid export membrane protein
MALILCLTALPIMLFPRFILSVMFSEKFASVGPLVYLFVISQFVLQLNGVYQALLISIDDVKIYTFITIIGQLFFAFMCLNLVPQYGIKAIAWGQVIGCSFIFFLTLMRLMRKHDFIIPRQISLLLGYTFSVVLLTGWICSQGDESNIFQVLLKIGWFILCVGGLFLFLNKEEKEYFGNLRDKLSFGG